MNICLACSKQLKRKISKYCSNKCQAQWQYKVYIDLWKSGKVDGNRGVNTRNVSNHLKRYLIEINGEHCSLCFWKVKHPITQRVPLEIDHINGDSEDNRNENLRLICPNCHSLSINFRNLNKGKGRNWRVLRYNKL